MNCQEVMELMQRHVDRDLDPQETTRMWEHVSKCPECAAMLNRLVQLSRGLEQLPRVVPPYSLVDAILPQLEGDEAAGMETIAEPYAQRSRARTASRARREWIGRLSAVLSVAVVVGLMLVSGPSLLKFGPTGAQQEVALAPDTTKDAVSPDTKPSMRDEITPTYSQAIKSLTQSGGDSKAVTKDAPSSPSSKPPVEGKAVGGATGAGSSPSPSPSAGGEPSTRPGPDDRVVPDAPRASDPVQNKGISPPASPSASAEPPVSIMEAPADEEVVSPDGQWKAVIREGKFQLVNVGNGAVVYESAAGDGTRSALAWMDDSAAVKYMYTDAEGNSAGRTFVISEMKEQTAP